MYLLDVRKLVNLMNDQMKSFVIQGTVFWLIISGITSPLLTYFPGVGVVFMIVHFVIAYFSWQTKTMELHYSHSISIIYHRDRRRHWWSSVSRRRTSCYTSNASHLLQL
jgi:hypothetical protein